MCDEPEVMDQLSDVSDTLNLSKLGTETLARIVRDLNMRQLRLQHLVADLQDEAREQRLFEENQELRAKLAALETPKVDGFVPCPCDVAEYEDCGRTYL